MRWVRKDEDGEEERRGWDSVEEVVEGEERGLGREVEEEGEGALKIMFDAMVAQSVLRRSQADSEGARCAPMKVRGMSVSWLLGR